MKKATYYTRKYREDYPWSKYVESAKSRCNNPNKNSYPRYGGRGIKFLMTMDEMKLLWFRDKAFLLKSPSIDRIDNDGNYVLDNCRFIENGENSSRKKKISCGKGHLFTEANTYTDRTGTRHCRKCCRMNEKRHRDKIRSQLRRAIGKGKV
jgi:hypothetical protein